jgi:hypothetical protein
MQTHQEIDLRSLALHRLVADKIRQDLSLLDKARAALKRWHAIASPGTFGYLDAWQGLLDDDVEACLAVATEQSERGDALRQASPLACLLTNQERFAFLKQWKADHAPKARNA